MDYRIVQAEVADAAIIANHRTLMFSENKRHSENSLAEMEQRYKEWLIHKIAGGDYIGWFAKTANENILGGVGLWLREWPPELNDYTGKQGYIENVYVVPTHRRQGIAHQLMLTLLEWARASTKVYYIDLHATSMAQLLYKTLGFEVNDGSMSLWIGQNKTKRVED